MLRAVREDRVGRYELLVELGRGGMAELYLAMLRGAGGFEKIVAIKRILPHLAQDKQFKEMFLNEGRIAANLVHPNVCQVFELEEDDGELFLSMEYLDGVSWDHLARELAPGNFAMRLAVGVIGQACEGLHYAHALRDVEGHPMHIVHRDVSPQNLFVTTGGTCKVLDFGVSKVMTDGPRTKSGVIKGKLPYMAPEQIRGEPVDGRADVFALGVCTWEALTAQRLFDRPTDFLIWKAITEEAVPAIATHWPECPPAVEAVVRCALDRDPEKRYATALDFAEALRAAAVLPPCTSREIAEAVKTRCADRLAERQRQVAAAISARRGAIDPDAAETQPRPVATSMEIRQQSVTLDLRTEAKRARQLADEEAAETRDLRRDAAETHADAKTVEPPPRDDEPAPHRSHLRTTILVAVIAAAVTAAVVVTVMMMNREEREPPPPPPATMPTINITMPPAPPPDAAPVVVEPLPADAAAPVSPPGRRRGKTTTPAPGSTAAGSARAPAPDPAAAPGSTREPSRTPAKGSSTAREPSPASAKGSSTTAREPAPTGPGTVENIHETAEELRKSGDQLREDLEKLRDQLAPK